MREPMLGDIYREESEEARIWGPPRIIHGSLYEVVGASSRKVRLRLWSGSGQNTKELDPVDLAQWSLWRSAKWAQLAQFS